MKSIKDFNWKNWVVVYLIFMIVLSLISGLVKTDIHAGFIFTMVLLIHLLAFIANQKAVSRLRYPLMAFIALVLIKTVISEFYAAVPVLNQTVNVGFAILVLVFVGSYIRDRLKGRRIAKEKIDEVAKHAPENGEINNAAPEEKKEAAKPEDVPKEKSNEGEGMKKDG